MPSSDKPRVIAYVDGFNLYYGSLRATPYRWLDVGRLVTRLLPAADVRKIWYFTAEPKHEPSDPTRVARHQEYVRALGTIANLEIRHGFYQLKPTTQRRVYPLFGPNLAACQFPDTLLDADGQTITKPASW